MKHHRWPKQGVAITPNKTERECLNGCNTVKVTRHEYPPGNPFGIHWPEYWRGLDQIPGTRAPVCEPAEVAS